MPWTLYPASEYFDRFRGQWDALNRAAGDHILLDSAFVALLLRYFGTPAVRLAVCDDPASPGLALLHKKRAGFWETFQPSQSPLGLIVLGSRNHVRAQMQGLIRALPGCALGVSVLQQDPDFTSLTGLTPGHDVEIVEYIRTARLTLVRSFDDYWNSRNRRFVRDLARQRRRLSERGVRLELTTSRTPEEVAEGVRQYGLLEGTGWKAEHGTAIAPDNRQGAFYRELLEHFSGRGEGVIYRLLMDGKTVAANLSVERAGMLIVLKITYDETLAGLSPGHLLEEEMLRALFAERRIQVEEYYGPFKDWQARWTDEVRTLQHLNFYRSASVASARRILKAAAVRLRSLRPRGRTPEPEPSSEPV